MSNYSSLINNKIVEINEAAVEDGGQSFGGGGGIVAVPASTESILTEEISAEVGDYIQIGFTASSGVTEWDCNLNAGKGTGTLIKVDQNLFPVAGDDESYVITIHVDSVEDGKFQLELTKVIPTSLWTTDTFDTADRWILKVDSGYNTYVDSGNLYLKCDPDNQWGANAICTDVIAPNKDFSVYLAGNSCGISDNESTVDFRIMLVRADNTNSVVAEMFSEVNEDKVWNVKIKSAGNDDVIVGSSFATGDNVGQSWCIGTKWYVTRTGDQVQFKKGTEDIGPAVTIDPSIELQFKIIAYGEWGMDTWFNVSYRDFIVDYGEILA